MDSKSMERYNRKSLVLIGVFLVLLSCKSAPTFPEHEISLTNHSQVDLYGKPVIIPRTNFGDDLENHMFPLLLTSEKDSLPVQLDDLDGDGIWDELFFLADIDAGKTVNLMLRWQEDSLVFEKNTSIRFGVRASEDDIVRPALSDTFYPHQLPGVMGYQPYQTDGPSWENDKVGFRHYLDGRNSKDVFGKKVSYLSPEDVGINEEGVTEDNYHVMEDWGRDILSVGNSVGIGGFGLLIGDQLARIGVTEQDSLNNVEATHFNIISNGPLRSLMQYEYENWRPLTMDRKYLVQERTSIWPGIHAFKNSVSFDSLHGDELLVVGLVNSRTSEALKVMEIGDLVVLYTHDKQTYEKEWYLGLGLILPKKPFLRFMEAPKTGPLSNTFLAILQIEQRKPVEYYAIAAWELSDPGFSQPEYFKDYLTKLALQLNSDLAIKVNRK